MALPVFRAASAKASGTGAVTPALPAGLVANDIVILIATTIAGNTISITANGSITSWTAITGSPQDVTAGEKLYMWWGRFVSGSTGPTVTPSGDHCCAGTVGYSGCSTAGTPIEATAAGSETTSDTSFSFATGVSTSGADRLVCCAYTTGQDGNTGQGGTIADSSLSSLATRQDFDTNSGGGGGYAFVEGGLASAGSCGTWSATMGNATAKAYISFALIPTSAATLTGAAITGGSSLFAPTVAYGVTAPSLNLSALFAPTTAYAMTGAFISAGSTLFAPTVTPVGADQPVTGATIASGSSLSAPTVAYVVAPPVISSGSVLSAPSLATTYDMTGATISSSSLFAPTVTPVYSMTGATIASGSSLFAPTVAYGVMLPVISGSVLSVPSLAATYDLTGATFTSSTLFAPTVSPIYDLAGATIVSGSVLFTPIVVIDQPVTGATVTGGSILNPPTLAYVVELPTISGSALLAPTLVTSYDMTGAFIVSGSVLFAPVLSVSGSLALPVLGPNSILFVPTTQAVYPLSLPALAGQSTLSAPTIAYQIQMLAITGGSSLFSPGVGSDEREIGLPTITGSTLMAPDLAYAVEVAFIPSTAGLFSPRVYFVVDLMPGPTDLTVVASTTRLDVAASIKDTTVKDSMNSMDVASSGTGG